MHRNVKWDKRTSSVAAANVGPRKLEQDPPHACTKQAPLYRRALGNEHSLRAVLSYLRQDAKRSRNTRAKINTPILSDHRLPGT